MVKVFQKNNFMTSRNPTKTVKEANFAASPGNKRKTTGLPTAV